MTIFTIKRFREPISRTSKKFINVDLISSDLSWTVILRATSDVSCPQPGCADEGSDESPGMTDVLLLLLRGEHVSEWRGDVISQSRRDEHDFTAHQRVHTSSCWLTTVNSAIDDHWPRSRVMNGDLCQWSTRVYWDVLVACLVRLGHVPPPDLLSPRKRREYVFTGVGLSICLSVCVSVCDHNN